jgi:SARP family transcriptional regulator, regulator of embCAB operon
MRKTEAMEVSARVQLCGTFAAELLGRRVDNLLPGRQGRLLFAYLVVSRLLPVSRNSLIDALWGDAPPADVGGALNALISKTRAVVGADVLRGRTELILALPEPAQVDVEVALSKLHVAESAVAIGDWRRAWTPALSAVFVARRTFLPEAEAPWVEVWRSALPMSGCARPSATPKPVWSLAVLSCRPQSVPRATLWTRHRSESRDICF